MNLIKLIKIPILTSQQMNGQISLEKRYGSNVLQNSGYFDENEAIARFNDYDIDNDKQIKINEFITSYLHDLNYCKQHIQEIKKIINENRQQKGSFEMKLNEAKVIFH